MTHNRCKYCKKIDLDNPSGYTPLGTRSWVEKWQEQCPFCDLLWHASQFEINDDDSPVGITWTSDGFVPGEVKEKKLTDFGDPMIVPIKPPGETLPSPEGFGRHINDSKVSSTTLTKWSKLCNPISHPARHGVCAPKNVWDQGDAGSSRSGLKDLWLVDVNTHCIHRIQSTDSDRNNYSYVVLSYVIGQDHTLIPHFSLSDLRDFESGIGVYKVKDMLPQTYLDAMTVVKMVGLSYLWVDALCLPDKDKGDIEKRKYEEGIANFDRIYEGATLTIVAADGKNANGGILAIKRRDISPEKRWQYRRNMPDGSKWGLIRGVYDRLKDHKYVTRGWT